MTPRQVGATVAAALLALTLAGCAGSAAHGGSNQPGEPEPSSASPGPAGNAQRVQLSQTSVQDLATTLNGNGVSDSDRWAKVIIENRPYPNDPTMAKLKQVLAQHGADQQTIAKIVNAVRP